MTRYPYDPEERLDLMRDVWEEHGLKTRHRMGGGFCQCPHPDHTHGDRKLSLTVHIGKFGTIMMFCGLDHQPEEIFDLVDLHPGILRGRRHKGQTSQNAAERGKKGGRPPKDVSAGHYGFRMIGSVQGKGRGVSVESESEPQTSDRQYLSAEELLRSYFSDDQLLKVIQRSTSSLIREAGEELYRRARDSLSSSRRARS